MGAVQSNVTSFAPPVAVSDVTGEGAVVSPPTVCAFAATNEPLLPFTETALTLKLYCTPLSKEPILVAVNSFATSVLK